MDGSARTPARSSGRWSRLPRRFLSRTLPTRWPDSAGLTAIVPNSTRWRRHSIEVSRQVPVELALWGLLHDAAEAFLSDIVRPLKSRCFYRRWDQPADFILPGEAHFEFEHYGACEMRILQAIARRYSLFWPIPDVVAVVDDRMLATERQQLFDDRQPHWDALDGIVPTRFLWSVCIVTARK